MSENLCPLCGSPECSVKLVPGANPFLYFIECKTMNSQFFVEKDTFHIKNEKLHNELFSLIYTRLAHYPISRSSQGTINNLWQFFYDPNSEAHDSAAENRINLADEKHDFPKTIIDKLDKALINLSRRYPNIGDNIDLDTSELLLQRILFCCSCNMEDEAIAMLKYLTELDYVQGEFDFMSISLAGWQRIEQLQKHISEVKQGFIAMSYDEKARDIREAFRSAIHEAGYKAQIIGEKEHNHQIVPEMFYEIERSKFLVVDVTYQNFGAYYEAGYAQALGKEVIVCCSKDIFGDPEKKPHFDIAQKPIIIWSDKEDLTEKLKRRIVATVH